MFSHVKAEVASRLASARPAAVSCLVAISCCRLLKTGPHKLLACRAEDVLADAGGIMHLQQQQQSHSILKPPTNERSSSLPALIIMVDV
jgi:hypothetical protein